MRLSLQLAVLSLFLLACDDADTPDLGPSDATMATDQSTPDDGDSMGGTSADAMPNDGSVDPTESDTGPVEMGGSATGGANNNGGAQAMGGATGDGGAHAMGGETGEGGAQAMGGETGDGGFQEMNAAGEMAGGAMEEWPPSRQPNGDKIGGCVLPHPADDVPADPYAIGEIVRSDAYAPFTKHLTVYGITLIGQDDVTDTFMEAVSETIQSIFVQGADTDEAAQRRLLINLYRYRSVIPLFNGEPNIQGLEGPNWDRLSDNHSLCDIIMQNVDGQVMEVLEHILHIVTDVGMHHTFTDDWAMTENSTLGRTMAQAVEAGIYDITPYDDLRRDVEVYYRIVIQEYAYWLVTTGWDVQSRFNPGPNSEWTLVTPADLEQRLPGAHGLYQRTSVPVMSAPPTALLERLRTFAAGHGG